MNIKDLVCEFLDLKQGAHYLDFELTQQEILERLCLQLSEIVEQQQTQIATLEKEVLNLDRQLNEIRTLTSLQQPYI